MLTLQELKRIVAVPAPEQKIPSARRLTESDKMVAREKLGADTQIVAYQSGYALYSVQRAVTVFPIHPCGGYWYDAGKSPCNIAGGLFEREAWYLRLVLEGEDRLFRNRESMEQRRTISYNAASEEWKELVAVGNSVLEQMVRAEAVEELLSVLTDRQRTVVCQFFLEQKTQGQIAGELGITASAVSQILTRAVRRMKKDRQHRRTDALENSLLYIREK